MRYKVAQCQKQSGLVNDVLVSRENTKSGKRKSFRKKKNNN